MRGLSLGLCWSVILQLFHCHRGPQGKKNSTGITQEKYLSLPFYGIGSKVPSQSHTGNPGCLSGCGWTRFHLYSQKFVSCINKWQSSSVSNQPDCINFFQPVYFCQWSAESFSLLSLLSKSFIYHFGSMYPLWAATSLSSSNSNCG